MMLKFMEIKSSQPKSAQKEISKQLGSSDSTIERYRVDIQLDSPYRRNKYKKKIIKSITSKTQTQSNKRMKKRKTINKIERTT